MEQKKIASAEVVLTAPGVVGKKVSDKYDCEILQISIEPGKLIPSHSMEMPATFTVVEGKGEAEIGGKVYKLEKGDIFELEAGINREWRNTGNEMLVIMTVKYMKYKQ